MQDWRDGILSGSRRFGFSFCDLAPVFTFRCCLHHYLRKRGKGIELHCRTGQKIMNWKTISGFPNCYGISFRWRALSRWHSTVPVHTLCAFSKNREPLLDAAAILRLASKLIIRWSLQILPIWLLDTGEVSGFPMFTTSVPRSTCHENKVFPWRHLQPRWE